ncbi:hypothetical protein [Streptomyces glomeratus]|uniref:Transcriptional regulator n=1 Tax=Streptomyces glomeratus TaxID=284452 RepID=A0ABP6M7Y3_9ACTN|nr:hypothetical protein [Streptomyces glomeratus]MCF1512591.1 hypothetical protein [Streptomyces glomeratus]
MREPYPPLHRTLARIEELRESCGLGRDEVFDTARLSYQTGVSEDGVRTLLDGQELNDQGAEARVRHRVTFLYESRRNGQGTSFDIREIAAAIGATTTWTRKLVTGEAKPSIVAGHDLAKFYGVSTGFLTDSPADALNRELQSVLFDLEVRADPEKRLKDLGVAHIAGRTSEWSRDQLVEVTRMVASIAKDLQRVANTVARMEQEEIR